MLRSSQIEHFQEATQCSAQKEIFQDLNINFPQTFRYAGGSYQEVARKPENSEVPGSRYKAKLNCRLRLNSTWMEDRNLRVLLAWVDIKLLESKANLSPTLTLLVLCQFVSISDIVFPRGIQW